MRVEARELRVDRRRFGRDFNQSTTGEVVGDLEHWLHRDPATIDINDFVDREDEGVLYVPKAGEMLYRLSEQ